MALINLRNALMAGKRLPYDAEVEFLESTGTQYINTGVVPTTTKTEITFSTPTPPLSGYMCGSFNANNNRYYPVAFGNRSILIMNAANTTIASYTNDGDVHTIVYNAAGGACYFDGAAAGTLSTTTLTASAPIYIFATSTATGPSGLVSGRVYSCKIYDEQGNLVRDYIPVRKGTVGYLYDRVSGKLFGNAGTGDFVLGPDVVPVEYIESHGTEYINCDIAVANGDSFEMSVLGAFTGTSSNMQLHGVNGGAYFGLQTNGNYTVGGQDTGVARDSADHAFALSATIGNSQVVSLGIDGNTYTRTRNNSAGYIGLFNLLDASTGNPLAYYSKFRMKDASIAVNSATVRTMKPVRVGTEGAMMDVLTRRIYRNQGTGAFTYGNDLKYPIPSE